MTTARPSPLVSRVLVTWLELTVVGLAGAFLGTTVGGLGAFVVYLATTLVSVGVLLYNVDALVTTRLADGGRDAATTTRADAADSEAIGEESVDEL
ncbi:hypothetical protein [Halorientalis marina]|uniref:hypothetical protein n=1 Tax=Halorientalis marina TaxID=2931976 RepID=UPI001FF28551|nr:hypothetical protein [Halorientalis marina]